MLSMSRRIIKAPAKINIGLNIVAKRDDGFHNLETLFYPIYDLYDELIFDDSDQFKFESELSFDNIIIKAVKLLEQHTSRNFPIKISLKKNIPIGAGLGGGSSDAAAVLITINEIFELNLSNNKLGAIALELGSDVPFFLKGKPAVGKSRGESLTNVDLNISYPILLVNPGIHVSTKEAFTKINPSAAELNYNEIVKIPVQNYRNFIVNDFEQSVFKMHPEIEEIKESLYSAGAMFALMSGSGSTVYGIFEDIDIAKSAAEQFPKDYFIFISSSLK